MRRRKVTSRQQIVHEPGVVTGDPSGVATVIPFSSVAAAIGAGNVSGPGSSVNNAFALMDGITGKLLKASKVLCVDTAVTGNKNLTFPDANIDLTVNTGTYPAAVHHTRHESGGADEIKLDDLKAPDDNTDLNASTAKHGLMPKLDNNANHFFNAQGAQVNPPMCLSALAGAAAGWSPADSTTYNFGIQPGFDPTVGGGYRLIAPRTGTITRVYGQFLVGGTPASAETFTVAISNVTAATAENISTSVKLSLTPSNFSNAAMTLAVTAGDALIVTITTPAWATNPTGVYVWLTIVFE